MFQREEENTEQMVTFSYRVCEAFKYLKISCGYWTSSKIKITIFFSISLCDEKHFVKPERSLKASLGRPETTY